MSQLINQQIKSPQLFRKKPGVLSISKQHLKVDMTPMVDLGFLLITFFVITTELSRPTTMNLLMPKDGIPVVLGESSALTILLDNKNIYYYEGKWENAIKTNSILKTDLSGKGLRKIITDKQKRLDIKKGGRNELMLLIKPAAGASYKNVVDALDEATINIVKKYALIKITPEENIWLKTKHE